MTWMFWLAILTLLCVIIFMGTALLDKRKELADQKRETERWKGEAKRFGWQSGFDQLQGVAGTLETSAEKLRQAAGDIMDQTRRLSEAGTAGLKTAVGELRQADAMIKESGRRLSVAANRMAAAVGNLPPAPPSPEKAKPPRISRGVLHKAVRPEPVNDPEIAEVVRRIEADAAAGRIERDPSKLN